MNRRPVRVLALDLGERRIGLALSDVLGLTAQPLGRIDRVGPRRDLQRMAELVAEHEVTAIVIGLPLQMTGQEGIQAGEARDFAERVRKRFAPLEVHLWDERLTTVEAERVLIAGNVRRKKRRDVVDTLAATLILQGYLDAHPSPGADR